MKIKSISIILVLTILAVAVGIGSIYYFMKIYLAKPRTIVPELVGKTIEKATDVATKQGVYIKVDGRKPSPIYPENTVISQDPKPGTVVVQGDVVHVYVSSGIEKAKIVLIGKNYADAIEELKAHNLSIGTLIKIPSGNFPANTVIAQYPLYITAEGIHKVDILVSSGKPESSQPQEEKLPEISSPTEEEKTPAESIEKSGKTTQKIPETTQTIQPKTTTQKTTVPAKSTIKTRIIYFSFRAPKNKESYKMTVIRIDKNGEHIEMQKMIKGGEFIRLKLIAPKGYNVVRILLDGKFFREDRYY